MPTVAVKIQSRIVPELSVRPAVNLVFETLTGDSMANFKHLMIAAVTAASFALPAMAQNENRNAVPEGQAAVTDLSGVQAGSSDRTVSTTITTTPAPYMQQSESPSGSASMGGNGGADGGG
jgi:hypothetical protein